MVNIDLLRSKIADAGFNIPTLATQMEINPATLYRRLSNGETFTIGEANRLVDLLKLTASESTAIFFNKDVA